MANALGQHTIARLHTTLPGLPRVLDVFRIVQLCDLHDGVTINRAFVQRAGDRANALTPLLIVLSENFVDRSVAEIAAEVAARPTTNAP